MNQKRSALTRFAPFLLLLVPFLAGQTQCPAPGDGGVNPLPSTQVPQAILAMEDAAFDLVNQERMAVQLPPLVHDNTARAVARAHSKDMADRDYFNHVTPEGLLPWDRMASAGMTYSMAGENIASNQGFGNPAGTAVTGWMNSQGHRANILNQGFTRTGMGVAQNAQGKWYFTQVFYTP